MTRTPRWAWPRPREPTPDRQRRNLRGPTTRGRSSAGKPARSHRRPTAGAGTALTTDHPDHEQLAAFQAGDGDRRQRADVEAHLAGCPSCAEVVAAVGGARGRLALLEDPALPPGLHDRLAAAVEAEAARAAPDGPAPRDRRRPGGRPAARPRRRY